MLNVNYSCLAKTSYIALAFNILLTIYLGIQMPKKDSNLNNILSNGIFSKCFLERPRGINEAPFFFQEVRISMLILSILFNFSRLIYEAVIHDISVILVAARLFLTILQLMDHWWFCKNWESFFIQKQMRPYMWFRFFFTVMMYSMMYCLITTFPPYRELVLIADIFQWVAGMQVMIWYYWGKHWDFRWGDMSDERRIRAIVGTMMTTSVIYAILSIYLFITSKLPWKNAIPVSSITATFSYLLMGFAFHYLNIVTNRSTQACLKILEESKMEISQGTDNQHRSLQRTSDGIPPPSLSTPLSTPSVSLVPTSFSSTRNNHNRMANLRQSLDCSISSVPSTRNSNLMVNIRASLESQRELSRREQRSTMTAEDVTRMYTNSIAMIEEEENRVESFDDQEENEYLQRRSIREYIPPESPLMSPNGSSRHDSISLMDTSNKSIILPRPYDQSDHENTTVHNSNRSRPIRIKPTPTHPASTSSSPNASRYNSFSHIETYNIGGSDMESGHEMEHISIKPNHAERIPRSRSSSIVPLGPSLNPDLGVPSLNNNHEHSNILGSGSLGPPLNDSMNDHSMIDHVPLARHNSLMTNLVTYETAHLLSDKIVVVFVQVVQWYIFMMIIERCIESYYEPEGYDDASSRIPVMSWCPVLSVFSGSTFASIQKIIDALF